MFKPILIFFFGLFVFQTARAQKQDTLLYYMKNSGVITPNKDSADYFMFIMLPDSATKLYPINEFYPNGKQKFIGLSHTRKHTGLVFEGSCMGFYPNGKRKFIANYKNGFADGEMLTYYPNGQLYTVEKYGGLTRMSKLIECRDSTGKILAESGNGESMIFDMRIKEKIIEGAVKDSIEVGEWKGRIEDTVNVVCVYSGHGALMSSKCTDPSGEEHVFPKADNEPEPKGGLNNLFAFLARTIKYPAYAKDHHVQGKALITFVVEKDGKLTNGRILRNPGGGIGEEALRAVILSPSWMPGIQYGMPVRVQYTLPVSLTLSND